jgi:hypothetical protein
LASESPISQNLRRRVRRATRIYLGTEKSGPAFPRRMSMPRNEYQMGEGFRT